MINISQIKYNKSLLSYNGDKLFIETPVLKCKTGINKYFNKYEIILEITDKDFINFMKELDQNNESHSDPKAEYRSNLSYMGGSYYLKLKVPFRYKKFEVDINSKKIYLPTIGDVKPDVNVKCKIGIPKLWHYHSNDNRYLSGTLMEIREIEIM